MAVNKSATVEITSESGATTRLVVGNPSAQFITNLLNLVENEVLGVQTPPPGAPPRPVDDVVGDAVRTFVSVVERLRRSQGNVDSDALRRLFMELGREGSDIRRNLPRYLNELLSDVMRPNQQPGQQPEDPVFRQVREIVEGIGGLRSPTTGENLTKTVDQVEKGITSAVKDFGDGLKKAINDLFPPPPPPPAPPQGG